MQRVETVVKAVLQGGVRQKKIVLVWKGFSGKTEASKHFGFFTFFIIYSVDPFF